MRMHIPEAGNKVLSIAVYNAVANLPGKTRRGPYAHDAVAFYGNGLLFKDGAFFNVNHIYVLQYDPSFLGECTGKNEAEGCYQQNFSHE